VQKFCDLRYRPSTESGQHILAVIGDFASDESSRNLIPKTSSLDASDVYDSKAQVRFYSYSFGTEKLNSNATSFIKQDTTKSIEEAVAISKQFLEK